MPMTVEIDRQGFTDMARLPTGPIHLWALKLAAKIDALAKAKLSNQMVHVRTGNLRSSQEVPTITVVGSLITITVTNKAKYALFVHEGTKPHVIEAKRAKVLTGWSWQGAPVFTPYVNHPGTKARPWLLDSMREALAALPH